MKLKVIVALDFKEKNEALNLCDQLDPNQCAVKVGSEMFTRFGSDLVSMLIARGFKVFLDLKFHDIPNTVAQACKAAADMGIWMLNVHAAGGLEMMHCAKQAIDSYGQQKPILIAVTVLTSMDENELQATGVKDSLLQQVSRLASLANEAELDGVVCSAFEAQAIKKNISSSFLTITPGIRLENDTVDDQKRIITPKKAIKMGSDYLVIGRPITRAPEPMQVLNQIYRKITI